MNTDTCDVCGGLLEVGSFPFCKGDPAVHRSRELGMLGEFHERDCGPGLPPEERYQTSFAELRAAERRHGLEPRSPNDPVLSQNEWGRREMARQHARPEMQRARAEAIREALQQHRR